MCAKQSLRQPAGEKGVRFRVRESELPSSPVPGNTIRSGYRVLRAAMGQPIPRSVDRDDAGRNALSGVKVSSPVKLYVLEWPSNYVAAKAISPLGDTPGVQVHGMYRRLSQELGKTPGRGTRQSKTHRQGLIAKSTVLRPRVLRSVHSSKTSSNCSTVTWKEVG